MNVSSGLPEKSGIAGCIRPRSASIPASSIDELIGRIPIKTGTSDAAVRRYVAGTLYPEQLRGLVLKTIKHLLGVKGYRAARSRWLSEQHDHLEMTDLSNHTHLMRQLP